MQITKIRLAGFKSFVEPAEIRIEPGLGGIVGPNGCGKSNLVEALYWAMGESATKKLRAGGMDDVIFAGAAGRAARNICEVELTLERDATGTWPAAYADVDVLEVKRRLVRGQGSTYSINGRETRALDVQLIFADSATGARSASMVRQGTVGELIARKPGQRGFILEEAAGISGLLVRRQKAVSKLEAAANNVKRLDDMLGESQDYLETLRRQARHAIRFHRLSTKIRDHEILLACLRWHQLSDEISNATRLQRNNGEALYIAEHDWGQKKQAHELAKNELEQGDISLAQCRAKHAHLERTLFQARESARLAAQRRDELAVALKSSNAMRQEYSLLLEGLENEQRDLIGDIEALKRRRDQLPDLAGNEGEIEQLRGQLTQAKQALAQDERARQAAKTTRKLLEQEIGQRRERAASLNEDWQEWQQHDLAGGASQLRDQLKQVEESLAAQNVALNTSSYELKSAETNLLACKERLSGAKTQTLEHFQQLQHSQHELETLFALIGHDNGRPESTASLAHVLGADANLARALTALLGQSLEAAIIDSPQTGSSHHEWHVGYGRSDQRLPDGIAPLSNFVKAPAGLESRFKQTGLLDESQQAQPYLPQLRPGQSLVNKRGEIWRWDGYHAKSSQAQQLERLLRARNRLVQLEGEIDRTQSLWDKSRDFLQLQETALNDAQEIVERLTQAFQAEQQSALRLQSKRDALQQRLKQMDTQARNFTQTLARLTKEREENSTRLREIQEQLQALPDTDEPEQHNALKMRCDQLQGALLALEQKRITSEQSAKHINTQIQQHAAQLARLRGRKQQLRGSLQLAEDTCKQQTDDLASLTQTQAGHQAQDLYALQQQLDHTKARFADLEQHHNHMKQTAKSDERAALDARQALHQLQIEQSALTEKRNQLVSQRGELADTIIHQFHCSADELPSLLQADDTRRQALALGDEGGQADLKKEHLQAKIEQWRADRGRLGRINLQAEQELETLLERRESLLANRDDVQGSIDRLNQSITQINQEGHARVRIALQVLREHFSRLFTTLFDGGSASLQLVQSEDPLDFGLEVMAQPPGKRLNRLSLMSGGEQALTATALIFANFLARPSPICVLDEVDAPLDDHNVERFCRLVKDVQARTGTRFLIITHNQLTMAQMNHLIGVTMMEKGVSKLISVELANASSMQISA